MSSRAGRTRPLARVEKARADLLQARRTRAALLQDVHPALEVALLARPEVRDRLVGQIPEDLAQLGDAPDVELALDPFGVGVERGAEPAFGPAQLSQGEVERPLAYLAQARLAGHLPAVEIGAGEQRVVVEHLLEMWDRPGGIDRVAGKAATELVVDAAARHRLQRRQRHLPLARRQQELERAVRGKLGRRSPASIAGVKRLRQRLDAVVDQ